MEHIDRDGPIPCRTFDLDSKLHGESNKAIARARIEIISDEQGAEDIAALDSEILEWLHVNEAPQENHRYASRRIRLRKSDPCPRKVGQRDAPAHHAHAEDLLQEYPGVDKPSTRARPHPSNASIFTYDAIKMYPSIETEACLERLATYLRRPETQAKFTHYHPDALIKALGLVMRNNRFKFGDILVKQIKGIAMGMSPAPPISNLYVAIHEEEEVLQYLACNWLLFLKRFIDDGIGIWLHHPDLAEDERRWKECQSVVARGGLAWDFSKRSNQIDFMDVAISFVDNRVEFKLFEKPLALHLYLPPHSCHPPGVIKGLVMGEVLRIFQLCSHDSDIDDNLSKFFKRLLDRGYQAESLCPLFFETARPLLPVQASFCMEKRGSGGLTIRGYRAS
ncbi:hypothetical protein THAOC_15909 [Thalassiosira oceanica]|uniref:Helix-turn-helix domain-containing protein n=1 Tax=Thalassiosira oceanica TaxID=159749 RepID=K0SBA6_THAOC|nr:hypothetical protein THAOC_15909 [Thalassiosira oceanica]|eukprot:EJK63428.1 hypothetical protein THAOC_15909 [Thalassiosira oceanica]